MNLIHGHDKKLLKFWDLDLIFKVTLEKKLLNLGQKPLNTHFLRSGSMDYTQVCMIFKNIDMTKVDAVFVTLSSLFKVT